MTMEKFKSNSIKLELFSASFMVLFQELALIRWLPGQVRALAYFPNLILISAFLGLGIGCLRAGKKSLHWLYPVSMVLLVVCAVIASNVAFTQESVSEHLWLLYVDLPKDAPVIHGLEYPIVIFFLLCCFTFIPLGQIIAERIQSFKEISSPIRGYCLDIIGSFIGVVIFAIINYLQISPIYWFACFLVVGLLLFFRRNNFYIYIVLTIIICFLVEFSDKSQFYSPYYAISYIKQVGGATEIFVNGSFHQVALKLNNDEKLETKYEIDARNGYHQPYRYLQKVPQKALVLGAGSGNDVSVMLDEGVKQIDAVEIDPVIGNFGRTLHPDKPYMSPKVRLFNTDARQYLSESKEKYDLIVFGTLDSMTRLSALSNVRLDNFVYTIESIQAAKSLLNPDGGIVLYFMTATPDIHHKIVAMLTDVFGKPPLVKNVTAHVFNYIYMSGAAFDYDVDMMSDITTAEKIDLPKDDWPYLYLAKKGIGNLYIIIITAIIFIAVIMTSLASNDMKVSIYSGKNTDIKMFFFGFAFLLLESKCITQMNLVWGATWLTSAVVFGSILAMIFFSTISISHNYVSAKTNAILLITFLIIVYFFPITFLLKQNPWLKLVMSSIYIGLPIGLAANCFAIEFAKRTRADLAFGWNMLGAVAGGLAEYFTMLLGFKAMLLFPILIYSVYLLGEFWPTSERSM